ncbi:hypothetical protein, partial [Treponema primitia]|uniref:hypothetical protein n=1 Tax=Treponema primitia TaxID=88058 RepID=UPI0002554CDF
YQVGTGAYAYGTGVSVAGTNSNTIPGGRGNVVLVKYDTAGTAQWAKTVSAGAGRSIFYSVMVDGNGNVYAAGSQFGTGTFTYGTGVSATGTSITENVVLVKYDTVGTAQWAKTVTAGADPSIFTSVAVDESGNVYAAGAQFGTGTFTYGPGIDATGSSSTGNNVVLVKYNV